MLILEITLKIGKERWIFQYLQGDEPRLVECVNQLAMGPGPISAVDVASVAHLAYQDVGQCPCPLAAENQCVRQHALDVLA